MGKKNEGKNSYSFPKLDKVTQKTHTHHCPGPHLWLVFFQLFIPDDNVSFHCSDVTLSDTASVQPREGKADLTSPERQRKS